MALTGKYYPYDATLNPSGYKAASLDEARAKEFWSKPENASKGNNPFKSSKSSSSTTTDASPTPVATGSRQGNANAKDARNGQYTTTESSVPVDDLGNPIAGSVYVYDLKLKRTVPSTIAIEYGKAFSNTKILSDIRAMLIKYGQLDPEEKNKATVLKAYQNILIGASTERVDTSSYVKNLQESGFGWNVAKGNAPGAPPIPERQVQPLERATIDNFVDSIYLSTKGQLASVEEKDKLFKEFNALNTGTVTTTKKVKNPKTGVLENVSTTTRGFNQDTAQAKLEADLKKNNPLEYQRRKAFEFSAEFNKIMSGGM